MTFERPEPGILHNEFDVADIEIDKGENRSMSLSDTSSAFYIMNLINSASCKRLISEFEKQKKIPVGKQGYSNSEEFGSVRATGWSEDLAAKIWDCMHPFLSPITVTETSRIDAKPGQWKPCGISPVFRFMKYESGGEHYAHYDAPYRWDENLQTAYSFVLYLNSTKLADGGFTRIIKDGQDNRNIADRDMQDWTERANAFVVDEFIPIEGCALLFQHRECHDVSFYTGTDSRYIIRGDVIFKRNESNTERYARLLAESRQAVEEWERENGEISQADVELMHAKWEKATS